jgi:phosphonate metabolism-associated iron-containing alcohol dehydrogenase
MAAFELAAPGRIVFGAGVLAQAGPALGALGAKRVLLVTGRSGRHADRLRKQVAGTLVPYSIPGEPMLAMVEEGRDLARREGCDAVVALGGGSAIDAGKAIAALAGNDGDILDYMEVVGRAQPLPRPGLPCIAIPTTAGTGAEVTPSMIILDTSRGMKVGLSRPGAAARVAVVDPELTLTLTPELTAATGLDALSHAFEASWSKLANPVSDALALDALHSILPSLERAYREPADLDAREGMSYGALAAGMAISHTATAALHGITYPLTARRGVPHGMACAFLLREVMAVNFHHLDCHKQKRLLHAMKSNTLQAALDLLGDLYAALHVPDTLDELGITEDDVKTFVDEAAPANLHRNIAPLGRKKIMELWMKKRA